MAAAEKKAAVGKVLASPMVDPPAATTGNSGAGSGLTPPPFLLLAAFLLQWNGACTHQPIGDNRRGALEGAWLNIV